MLLTALFTGLFCRFALRFDWLESLLIGSVLGSTDAASVFYILRSKKLNLKYGTSSMLELDQLMGLVREIAAANAENFTVEG